MSELIDRQDVIDRLKKAEDVFRKNGAKLEANGIHYALELVESDIEIPTVEPEITNDDLQAAMTESYHLGYELAETKFKRPHGKWEEPFEMNGKSYHKCTNCHISSELILIDKYCPNCGAKMDKEADNENDN